MSNSEQVSGRGRCHPVSDGFLAPVNIESSQMTIPQAHLLLAEDHVQLRESLSYLLTAVGDRVRFEPLENLTAPAM